MEKARYTFRVEWFDQQASLKRFYLLFYIVRMDGMDEIEIVRAPLPCLPPSCRCRPWLRLPCRHSCLSAPFAP